jgi:hypothetical protein
MHLRLKFILAISFLMIALLVSGSAIATWEPGVYTVYPYGNHPITAPPGITVHYAQNLDGVQDAHRYYYDPWAPTVATAPQVFAANPIKPITLNFTDNGLSGIETVDVRIKNVDDTTTIFATSTTGLIIIPEYDFSEAGLYDLEWRAIDKVPPIPNDSGWQTESGFFHVVANVPVWTDGECSGDDYQTSCPSTLEISSGSQISDGGNPYDIVAKLVDRYGNRVIPEAGIKTVEVNFNFANTNHLDQITELGDPIKIIASDLNDGLSPSGFSLEGELLGTDKVIKTELLTEMTNINGELALQVYSFAPTSICYKPIMDNNFNFSFESIDYLIVNEDVVKHPVVGATAVNAFNSDPASVLAFSPTLTTTPEAFVWDIDTMSFTSDPVAGKDNITINAPKRFNIKFKNRSTGVEITIPEFGLIMDSHIGSVIWDSDTAMTETPGVISLTLDNKDDGFDTSKWNGVNSLIGSVGAEVEENIRMRATPVLAPGSEIPLDFTTTIRTFASYKIGDRRIRYQSEQLNADGAGDGGCDGGGGGGVGGSGGITLFNPSIEIIGSVRSESGTSSKQSGDALNQSLGDITQGEFKASINRNTAALIKDANVSACSAGGEITNLTTFWSTNPSCTHSEDSVLYLSGDTILNLSGNLPSGAKTILIENGDLYLKNNLAYTSSTSGDSFGVVVLNGNIFISPNVTNVAGAYYAEGSLISVNALGQYGEDLSVGCNGSAGFCDRSFELHNQLYWKGLVATQNTIGGSDKADSGDWCPSGITICGSRETARVYDFAYLRTFHPGSGGTQIYPGSDSALIVEYDSRVQSNPPPLFASGAGGSSGQLGN